MIYHICSQQAWRAALEAGDYRAESLIIEGFIHCSGSEQILGVANSFYAGQIDLVLLLIEPEHVAPRLVWEAAAHPDPDAALDAPANQQFPHIYGPLNLDAVVEVRPFQADQDGRFRSYE
jgi:uncharacterized protein (DUF952 family)